MTSDPKILGLALLGGIIPSLLWLWFWLKEDKEDPEPKGLLAICFVLGMLSIALVVPLQKLIQNLVSNEKWQIVGWASVEEIVKYLIVVAIVARSTYLHKPIDWPVYIITVALGFAAMENAMFLVKPLSVDQATVGILTGHLRYLGSTLLHAVSSGLIGIMLGLSFYLGNFARKFYFLFGLVLAVGLHSIFNFFIMKDSGGNSLKIFAFLWVATVVNLLLFEKLRRMSIDQKQNPPTIINNSDSRRVPA